MRMEEVERGREETPHQEFSTNMLQAVDGAYGQGNSSPEKNSMTTCIWIQHLFHWTVLYHSQVRCRLP